MVFTFKDNTMSKITLKQIEGLAKEFGYEVAAIRAVMAVESGGHGFDEKTGKILIQFEPHIFKRYTKKTIVNGVEGQTKEWAAFNEAWAIDKEATMLSTSFGLPQVMGFNHKAAGYKTVGEMVDAFKLSEENQVRGMLNFIKSNKNLHKAIKEKDWRLFAFYYNGPNYQVNKYDAKLATAYAKYC
jgi:hypothetical protein